LRILRIAEDKFKIIHDIYYEPAGYGSVKNTWLDAKKKDPTITLNIVKQWFDKNIPKNDQVKGYNSFVAPHAYYEFQMDLFFINEGENQNIR
jgi:hypothetical protein